MSGNFIKECNVKDGNLSYKKLSYMLCFCCRFSGKHMLLAGLSMFIYFGAFAQKESLKFYHITTEQGLTQINVNCVRQDSRGLMWIGTRNGLNRYDGYRFTTFRNDAKNRNSISNNMINDMVEDKAGNIWLATQEGLNRYNRKLGYFTRYVHDDRDPKSISTNLISRLALDSSGNIWVATQNSGLDYFNLKKGTFQHHLHDDADPMSIADNNARTIFIDSRQKVWVGTASGGLAVYNSKRNSFDKVMGTSPGILTAKNIYCLFEDDQKRLWIGSQDAGLFRYDQGMNRFTHYQHLEGDTGTLSSDAVYSLGNDEAGNLWVGTENGGLSILNKRTGRFDTYMHDEVDYNSLNGNSIYSICRDRSGNMWLGAFGGGINLFRKSTANFALYRHNASPGSLSNNFVLDISQDSRRRIWLGTDGGGLNLFNPLTGNFKNYKKPADGQNGITGNFVLVVDEDHSGKIWIGTWGDGASIFDPRTGVFTNLKRDEKKPDGIGGNNIYNLLHTRDGKTWLSTFNDGLDQYDPATGIFKHYRYNLQNPDGLGSDRIYALFEDRNDKLWLGTSDAGLDLLDRRKGTFVHYKHREDRNSISNNGVTEIFEDSKSRLWLGTLSGLNLFDPVTGHFTIFGKKDGLPSDIIYAIREDAEGMLWISTNGGLTQFNPRTKIFKNYSTEDGVQADEFKPHSALKTSDGKLYFGGVNGFNVFDPGKVINSKGFAPIILTSFSLFNKPLTVAQNAGDPSPLKKDISEIRAIKLNHKQSVFSFEFAALDYASPDKKEYAYQLEGFDPEWNLVGNKNSASYTNLSPGVYRLKLKYQNASGDWSPVTMALVIDIIPPFWMTWWFRTVIIIAAVSAVYGLFRYRIRLINRQRGQLEKQVKERTESLARLTIEERKSREEAEEAREEAEKARKDADDANKAKSIFLATMSHEIRTPMNGVIGMATLLSNTKLTTEQEEYTDTIRSCGDSLLNVINDILDFTKIETGHMELEAHDFDLRDCVEGVLGIFAEKASRQKLDLVYQMAPNVPPRIIGDPLRLGQVLINLVGNAMKFTSKGEVFIDIQFAGVTESDLVLQFSVRDTGIGIPADKLHKLFRAFSQVDSGTTRKYGGTGLGLAISEKLINLMGGTISVSSEAGSGATFTFTVQVKAGQKSERTYVNLNTDALRLKTILVVDDNDTNRNILMTQLKQWGFLPLAASSGEEALELIKKDNFDLVITDMDMPVMNGAELARRVRVMQKKLHLILLSSIGYDRLKTDAGLFDVVVTKPVKHDLLYKQIIDQLRDEEAAPRPVQTLPGQLTLEMAQRFPLDILIAEDNMVNQKVIMHILKKMGYSPDLSANGHEVLEAIARRRYDMILMDIQMPEMDGLEATRFIREHLSEQPVIVAMTANAMVEDREACLQAGMNDYLSKPMKLAEIIAVLEKWGQNIKN
ncbi:MULTISPECIES: two-component regulator propeller domain-containing protein [unclassified Mucilaginibacter]|uniref:hybrid sensor histidine kinase/response regulator n=3 Tax=Mucilaginibacter TaxID=423349 RepID=UPI002B23C47F|nr:MULTISPECIES: two-component regulator propeller domain-containing protein [unclassified Mucilaginibacter]MEB0280803.1 two-component regulator propeller domain-containing protein [Mucilaginibacter sp. 10B2]MEB0302269.1 two-component regulator propeller domain-containing protein [Mucilaginibacter sp. 5C4]